MRVAIVPISAGLTSNFQASSAPFCARAHLAVTDATLPQKCIRWKMAMDAYRARGAPMEARSGISTIGAPKELRLDEVPPPPERGRGQIRVQVRAWSSQPMDWKIRRGE